MNWAEFFSMDGKGFYVWGSFGAFLLCIVVEIIVVRLRIGSAQEGVRETAAVERDSLVAGKRTDQAGM